MSYKSQLITLKDIVDNNQCFTIPIYQRLYVWGDEQVKKLLNDLWKHFNDNPNKDYFLGGVIVLEKNRRFELIDGQQRFTTLWLLGRELKRELEMPFANESRLQFAIRDHANQYFSKPISDEDSNDDDKELSNIKAAQSTIRGLLHEFKGHDDNPTEKLKKFGEFLQTHVKLIFTQVPEDVNLNKLFEVLNSGGVQLQQHELLKAKMLEKIKNDTEYVLYGRIWDACANMDAYLEDNLSSESGKSKTEIGAIKDKDYFDIENTKELLKPSDQSSESSESAGLQHILENTDSNETAVDSPNKSTKDHPTRSIISFSLLLQHTLRIFLKQNDKNDCKLDEKNLIGQFDQYFFDVFNTNDAETIKKAVKGFLDLLWQVRVVFDDEIIKWLEKGGEDEILTIQRRYSPQSDGTINRQEERLDDKPCSVLQSMLYHTQESVTHYWLTPFLQFLLM